MKSITDASLPLRCQSPGYLKQTLYAVAVMFGLSVCISAGATPITYSFTQGGFDDGATVTGTFTGGDFNSNGYLESFDGEVTGFSMHFSGNSLVAAFSLDFADLGGLIYDLNGGPLLGDETSGGMEGIGGTGPEYQPYAVGPGPFRLCDGTHACGFVSNADDTARSFTSEAVVVTSPLQSVPGPSGLGMMALGLIGIGFLGKKSRKDKS